MTRRVAPILALLLGVGACEAPPASPPQPGAPGETAGLVDDDRVECRIGRAAEYERFCTVERQASADGDLLLIRKPDGGFRRLRMTSDGRGVVAADGAEPAIVTLIDETTILVELGGDSFRLPARVAP